ncbi:serine hydrolase, partial [Spirillospora sp. NPDC049652]
TAQTPAKSAATGAIAWFTGAHGTSVFGGDATDAAGLISGLYFTRQPGSWREVDAGLRKIAPDVSFVTAEIGRKGRCRVLHGVNPDTPRPLASASKLYILGALSDAVAREEVSWETPLAVNEAWRSLPPAGELRNKRAGSMMTLAQYADSMMSVSDNTAADHLVHRLGREAVENELTALGNRHAQASRPWLTTREELALKGTADYPAGARRYLALPAGKRAEALSGLDAVKLADVKPWEKPRDVDRIGWFASPLDVCAAFKGLSDRAAKPGQSPLGHALSMVDGGIQLDPKKYPTVWYKGGGEPGVLTANYLARTSGGRVIVTSAMLSDPKRSFSGNAELALLALSRAGIQLAGESEQ